MSPTRKTNPPDKGAPPEHKPSRKVALEEVMRTLQDLVSNELANEPEKPAGEAQTTAAKTKKTGSAEKQSATRPALSAEVLPAAPAVVAESPAETSPPAGSGVPPEGLQQELPYFEAAPPAPTAYPPEAVEPQVASFSPEKPPIHEVKSGVAADSGASIDTAPATTAEEINWDDIPVLEEVVELAEETDTDEVDQDDATDGGGRPRREPAVEADPDGDIDAMGPVPSAANLPPVDTAHRLAVQVAARLNVELRKSGQTGLNSDVITRLARLLEEALAKAAPNMENTPVNKASFTDGGSAEREAVPAGTNAGAVFRPPPDKH
jgi:hypothetical protein